MTLVSESHNPNGTNSSCGTTMMVIKNGSQPIGIATSPENAVDIMRREIESRDLSPGQIVLQWKGKSNSYSENGVRLPARFVNGWKVVCIWREINGNGSPTKTVFDVDEFVVDSYPPDYFERLAATRQTVAGK